MTSSLSSPKRKLSSKGRGRPSKVSTTSPENSVLSTEEGAVLRKRFNVIVTGFNQHFKHLDEIITRKHEAPHVTNPHWSKKFL